VFISERLKTIVFKKKAESTRLIAVNHYDMTSDQRIQVYIT